LEQYAKIFEFWVWGPGKSEETPSESSAHLYFARATDMTEEEEEDDVNIINRHPPFSSISSTINQPSTNKLA